MTTNEKLLPDLLMELLQLETKYAEATDVSFDEACKARLLVADLKKSIVAHVGRLSETHRVNYQHIPSLGCPYCGGVGETSLLHSPAEDSVVRPCICGFVEPHYVEQAAGVIKGIRLGYSSAVIDLLKKVQPFVAGGPLDGVLLWLESVHKPSTEVPCHAHIEDLDTHRCYSICISDLSFGPPCDIPQTPTAE